MSSSRAIGGGALFILSLLLSPVVGFIIALFYPSNEKYRNIENQNSSINFQQSKVCPKCAEQVKLAAKLCKHCGHTFDIESQLINESGVDIEKEFEVIKSCSKCSRQSDVDSRWENWICPTCFQQNQ